MSRETDDELQIDRRETLIRGWNDFLMRGFDWSWWGSLQLKSGRPTTKEAGRRFNEWIDKLQAEEGTSKFRWVRIIEPGHLRRNPHLHILVSGLVNRRTKWERRWNELGDGDAQISVYDRERNGILYMLKTMDNGEIDVDFKLPKL
jgi:hypothetical protein